MRWMMLCLMLVTAAAPAQGITLDSLERALARVEGQMDVIRDRRDKSMARIEHHRKTRMRLLEDSEWRAYDALGAELDRLAEARGDLEAAIGAIRRSQ